jgi:hypothetical protein
MAGSSSAIAWSVLHHGQACYCDLWPERRPSRCWYMGVSSTSIGEALAGDSRRTHASRCQVVSPQRCKKTVNGVTTKVERTMYSIPFSILVPWYFVLFPMTSLYFLPFRALNVNCTHRMFNAAQGSFETPAPDQKNLARKGKTIFHITIWKSASVLRDIFGHEKKFRKFWGKLHVFIPHYTISSNFTRKMHLYVAYIKKIEHIQCLCTYSLHYSLVTLSFFPKLVAAQCWYKSLSSWEPQEEGVMSKAANFPLVRNQGLSVQ